jgi:hypothetical protein
LADFQGARCGPCLWNLLCTGDLIWRLVVFACQKTAIDTMNAQMPLRENLTTQAGAHLIANVMAVL